MKIILTLKRLFHLYYKYYYHLAPLLNFISFTTNETVVENFFLTWTLPLIEITTNSSSESYT